ncbi:hypothetical protein [Nocardioides sp. 1609]|uniref:hypothetical protein n=1 Tax=Nocardioides sp. 1609 TaxID=2508327 RepID=UPI0010703C69|nr:hypothetical protein [Nocardioides sp. 1609]
MHRRTGRGVGAALVLALVLAVGGLAPASSIVTTASAATTTTVVPGVVGTYPDYGSADVRNQRLRRGCHTYRVDYVLRPPTPDWSALVQLYTPRSRKLGTLLLDANRPDPLVGHRGFEICGVTVAPGRFRIQVELIYTDGREEYRALTRPTFFRLTRRR